MKYFEFRDLFAIECSSLLKKRRWYLSKNF